MRLSLLLAGSGHSQWRAGDSGAAGRQGGSPHPPTHVPTHLASQPASQPRADASCLLLSRNLCRWCTAWCLDLCGVSWSSRQSHACRHVRCACRPCLRIGAQDRPPWLERPLCGVSTAACCRESAGVGALAASFLAATLVLALARRESIEAFKACNAACVICPPSKRRPIDSKVLPAMLPQAVRAGWPAQDHSGAAADPVASLGRRVCVAGARAGAPEAGEYVSTAAGAGEAAPL